MMAFDGTKGGQDVYDYVMARIMKTFSLTEEDLAGENVEEGEEVVPMKLFCTFKDSVIMVFDEDSLMSCFALSDIAGEDVLSLTLSKESGASSCMVYPSEDVSVTTAIYQAVKSEVQNF